MHRTYPDASLYSVRFRSVRFRYVSANAPTNPHYSAFSSFLSHFCRPHRSRIDRKLTAHRFRHSRIIRCSKQYVSKDRNTAKRFSSFRPQQCKKKFLIASKVEDTIVNAVLETIYLIGFDSDLFKRILKLKNGCKEICLAQRENVIITVGFQK